MIRMRSGASRTRRASLGLRARGPYPASSAGGRAADSARPGGHHDPSGFDPAGTVMARGGPLFGAPPITEIASPATV